MVHKDGYLIINVMIEAVLLVVDLEFFLHYMINWWGREIYPFSPSFPTRCL